MIPRRHYWEGRMGMDEIEECCASLFSLSFSFSFFFLFLALISGREGRREKGRVGLCGLI